jgi:hypothetical protein
MTRIPVRALVGSMPLAELRFPSRSGLALLPMLILLDENVQLESTCVFALARRKARRDWLKVAWKRIPPELISLGMLKGIGKTIYRAPPVT